VPGNEVRVGGFRVGVVDTITPTEQVVSGHPKSVAKVHMKLDKSVQPLSKDTTVLVRARSALGLKYVQLTPGRSKQTYRAGDTIPLSHSTLPVEFDDLLNTFDEPTRVNSQAALTGFGNALAGRGASLNEAIQGLNPFFRFLTPVMANLSDPRTQLNQFFKNIGAASAQVAPVAEIQALLFRNMAITFRAFNVCPDCLRQTIEKGPPTEDTAIRSFRVQDPFLSDFADLSRRLIPAAQVLPSALPKINSALEVGTPVVRSSTTLNQNTTKLFNGLNDLVQDPNTLLAFRDLHDTISVVNPFINYVGPYQTVCNYATYFLTGLSGDVAFDTGNGTAQAGLLMSDGQTSQANTMQSMGSRPADIPSNVNPYTAHNQGGSDLQVLHTQAYGPAIDAQGRANCGAGQTGYPSGPFEGPTPTHPGYEPTSVSNPGSYGTDSQTMKTFDEQHAGGSHTVNWALDPLLLGPTFTGVKNLKDVP
jgi:virulence factor Mce-like protein